MSSSPSFDIQTTYSNSSLRCVNVTKQTANITSEKSETDDINKMSFDFGVEFSQDSDLNEEELVSLVEESKGKVKYFSFACECNALSSKFKIFRKGNEL